LAKSSYGTSPLWLHHKIDSKKKKTPKKTKKKLTMMFIYLFGLFFGQFCDAAKVAVIHMKI